MGEDQEWVPTSPQTSWVKKHLENYFGPRIDVERAVDADPTAHGAFCPRKLLIVIFLAALVLAVMGLLLFWNYQCIFVWHLCYEDSISSDYNA